MTSIPSPGSPATAAGPRQASGRASSGRIPVIDGLRGMAVLAVLFFHVNVFAVSSGTAAWERAYKNVAGLGWAGVDLFFVLSGFLITGILIDSRHRPDYYRVFYARRTVRIFPLYYLSLLFVFGVAPLALKVLPDASTFRDLTQPSSAQVFAWLYILNWRMGLASFSVAPPLIQHFWSLSIEEQFYLAWPSVVRKLTDRRLLIACAALAGVSFASRVLFELFHLPSAAYALTISRLDALAIGAAAALAIRNTRHWDLVGKKAPWIVGAALGGLVAIVVLTREVAFYSPWMVTFGISLWALFFGGCLVIVLQSEKRTLIHRMTSSRLFRFFGKYSYCIYLCHQPLILALVRFGVTSNRLAVIFHSRTLAIAGVNCIAILLAVAISLVSWNLIESPFLRLKELPLLRHGAG